MFRFSVALLTSAAALFAQNPHPADTNSEGAAAFQYELLRLPWHGCEGGPRAGSDVRQMAPRQHSGGDHPQYP